MEEEFYYIGIDNGTTGSITILDNYCKIIYHDAVPTIQTINYTKKIKYITRINFKKLVEILSPYSGKSRAITERPAINPKFMNTSILAARSFEILITALEYVGIGYEVIDSKEWQKAILGNIHGKDLKFIADEKAKQLFQIDVKKGFGDSILIAYYLFQKVKGNLESKRNKNENNT
jgi:hypothetical protein